MRRAALPLLLLLSAGLAMGQAGDDAVDPAVLVDDFFRTVDGDTTLENITDALNSAGPDAIDPSRIYLLTGQVAAVTYLDPTPDPALFWVELEIVGGRWEGLEDVEIFRAFVNVYDPFYADLIPQRPPRDDSDGLVVAGTEVLISALYLDAAPLDDGGLVPVFQALTVRPLN